MKTEEDIDLWLAELRRSWNERFVALGLSEPVNMTGEVLEGELKPGKLKLVQAWIEIHQDELMADWELASQGQAIFRIEPLK